MLSKTISSAALAVSMAIMSGGWATDASAEGFQLDVTFKELTRAQEQTLISDLRVGDTAIIQRFGNICAEDDGRLYIVGHRRLTDRSDMFTELEIRRIPDRKFDITILLGNRVERGDAVKEYASILSSVHHCDERRTHYPLLLQEEDFELFEINTIDGYHRASDLLAGR